MERLLAVSYHAPICARAVTGVLHAVFERAWHLSLPDESVLTVTTSPHDGPMAIRLHRRSLAGLPVRPGMPARLEGDTLTIGPVVVDLRSARSWAPDYRDLPPIHPDALRRDRELIESASRTRPEGALDAPWTAPIESTCAALQDALLREDNAGLAWHAPRLVGLGPGLTPSGDDILCGLLAASFILALRGSTIRLPHAVVEAIETAAKIRTTLLGRTLLHWAARGVAAQPLLDVLLSVGSEGPLRGLHSVQALGHTSGRDMLAGVSRTLGACC